MERCVNILSGYWKNPGRQDISFTPFVPSILPVYYKQWWPTSYIFTMFCLWFSWSVNSSIGLNKQTWWKSCQVHVQLLFSCTEKQLCVQQWNLHWISFENLLGHYWIAPKFWYHHQMAKTRPVSNLKSREILANCEFWKRGLHWVTT